MTRDNDDCEIPTGGKYLLMRMCKIGLADEAHTTILYSTGVKVVVNTTVGQLGAV